MRGLGTRLHRLEKATAARGTGADGRAACACCAGIDFRTGEGEWAPGWRGACIVLDRDDGRSIGWCKRCGRAISAVMEPRPHGRTWRVSAARPDELPV